jgi:hypothetical protein
LQSSPIVSSYRCGLAGLALNVASKGSCLVFVLHLFSQSTRPHSTHPRLTRPFLHPIHHRSVPAARQFAATLLPVSSLPGPPIIRLQSVDAAGWTCTRAAASASQEIPPLLALCCLGAPWRPPIRALACTQGADQGCWRGWPFPFGCWIGGPRAARAFWGEPAPPAKEARCHDLDRFD